MIAKGRKFARRTFLFEAESGVTSKETFRDKKVKFGTCSSLDSATEASEGLKVSLGQLWRVTLTVELLFLAVGRLRSVSPGHPRTGRQVDGGRGNPLGVDLGRGSGRCQHHLLLHVFLFVTSAGGCGRLRTSRALPRRKNNHPQWPSSAPCTSWKRRASPRSPRQGSPRPSHLQRRRQIWKMTALNRTLILNTPLTH